MLSCNIITSYHSEQQILQSKMGLKNVNEDKKLGAIPTCYCHSERKFFWHKKIVVEESRGAEKMHGNKKVYKG